MKATSANVLLECTRALLPKLDGVEVNPLGYGYAVLGLADIAIGTGAPPAEALETLLALRRSGGLSGPWLEVVRLIPEGR